MHSQKVSILIPTYNRAGYLPQAIESSLAQNYPDIEVIVSDNASADETGDIVRKYAGDPRFRYYRNSRNIGMAPNWQKLVCEYATGDWFILISDDDYFIDSNYITKAMNLVSKYNSLVIVYSNYQVVETDANGNSYVNKYELGEYLDGREYFLNYYTARAPGVSLITAVCKREPAVRLNVFSNDVLCPDTEAFLKMLLHGDVGFLPDITACYRIHGSNTFARIDNAKIDRIFQNKLVYMSAYEHALAENLLDEKVLFRWKNRILTQYLFGVLTTLVVERREFVTAVQFVKLIYYDDKRLLFRTLLHLLSPKFLVKFLLSLCPPLHRAAKTIWARLRYKKVSLVGENI
jgi:glycosyltransferase involved in cell wall biosynthesis